MEGIPAYFTVDGKLRDNASRGIYRILDSGKDAVRDHRSDGLYGRGYSSEAVMDSCGRAIDCPAVFIT